jgi:hypothetical protein
MDEEDNAEMHRDNNTEMYRDVDWVSLKTQNNFFLQKWTAYNRVVEGLRCVQPINSQEI